MGRKKGAEPQHGVLDSVGRLTADLRELGVTPVLVGGMALVALGSQRVTRDFDFLVAAEARQQPLDVYYRHGFELVSKLDDRGHVLSTIDNPRVASARLRIDEPDSAYFYNHALGLRVDLLFDFPLPAQDVLAHATPRKIGSHAFHIASKEDLTIMKKVAAADRAAASDLQDLEFLNSLKS